MSRAFRRGLGLEDGNSTREWYPAGNVYEATTEVLLHPRWATP
jgi:hypothetical protein